jgi:electron transport complex protein RnfE
MNETKFRSFLGDNPVLVLFLGACPAMAASSAVLPALGMAGAVLLTMLLSTAILSALRRLLPLGARLPAAILVTAGVVSVLQLLMNALLPSIYQLLGVYLAVVAVNLMVFSGTETAESESFGAAMKNALLTALGFAAAILVMAAVREVLGSASFAGIKLTFLESYKLPILTKASGGFAVFAFLLSAVSALSHGRDGAPRGMACAAALGPTETEE